VSVDTAPGLTWPQLAAEIAELGRVPVEQVRHESLLVDDLGLDSLALAELVVLLSDGPQAQALAESAETRDWSTVTAGELWNLATGDASEGGA
jgi:acyl carrier protein